MQSHIVFIDHTSRDETARAVWRAMRLEADRRFPPRAACDIPGHRFDELFRTGRSDGSARGILRPYSAPLLLALLPEVEQSLSGPLFGPESAFPEPASAHAKSVLLNSDLLLPGLSLQPAPQELASTPPGPCQSLVVTAASSASVSASAEPLSVSSSSSVGIFPGIVS